MLISTALHLVYMPASVTTNYTGTSSSTVAESFFSDSTRQRLHEPPDFSFLLRPPHKLQLISQDWGPPPVHVSAGICENLVDAVT